MSGKKDVKYPVIQVRCVATPEEWQTIRLRCFARRQTIGRFVVEAALLFIKQEKEQVT